MKEEIRDTVEFLGINISTAKQSSDWGNDKLSHEQLVYAASDVLYLHLSLIHI